GGSWKPWRTRAHRSLVASLSSRFRVASGRKGSVGLPAANRASRLLAAAVSSSSAARTAAGPRSTRRPELGSSRVARRAMDLVTAEGRLDWVFSSRSMSVPAVLAGGVTVPQADKSRVNRAAAPRSRGRGRLGRWDVFKTCSSRGEAPQTPTQGRYQGHRAQGQLTAPQGRYSARRG